MSNILIMKTEDDLNMNNLNMNNDDCKPTQQHTYNKLNINHHSQNRKITVRKYD